VVAAGARSVEVRFTEPAGQVSPGQAVVLYRGDEVLGGGVVEESA
jgi:tRNA-specific 2-thiouridylase